MSRSGWVGWTFALGLVSLAALGLGERWYSERAAHRVTQQVLRDTQHLVALRTAERETATAQVRETKAAWIETAAAWIETAAERSRFRAQAQRAQEQLSRDAVDRLYLRHLHAAGLVPQTTHEGR